MQMSIQSVQDPHLKQVIKWATDYLGKDKVLFDYQESKEHRIKFVLYSNEYEYHIVAMSEDGRTYLGCTLACRKRNIGENHIRGNDLADGVISEETWNSIIRDIARCELLSVE